MNAEQTRYWSYEIPLEKHEVLNPDGGFAKLSLSFRGEDGRVAVMVQSRVDMGIESKLITGDALERAIGLLFSAHPKHRKREWTKEEEDALIKKFSQPTP